LGFDGEKLTRFGTHPLVQMLLHRGLRVPATVFLAAGFVMSIAFSATPGNATAGSGDLHNIEYAQANGAALFLDANIPEGQGPFPAAIIVHGGGWVRGDRMVDPGPLFAPLARAGIAWFSIDYRLSNDVSQFGAAIEDVENAIRFVKAHAREYRIDPERIALIGESAGGQLAAMAALDPAPGTQVMAVVALYAPTDLVKLAKTSEFVPKQIRDSMVGTPFEQLLLARLGQLSPIDNVKPGAPPFLLIHGTEDALVPFSQSRAMCERMAAAGASCELFPVQGGGHGIRWWDAAHPAEAEAYKREMVTWLKDQFAHAGKRMS
jgi:acetyl esterase